LLSIGGDLLRELDGIGRLLVFTGEAVHTVTAAAPAEADCYQD
jgi:hypothetical protein